jgi:hypothetical protein
MLVVPGVYKGNTVKGWAQRKRDSRCRRKAGAWIDVVDPFHNQAQALVLPVAKAMCGW